jgi:ABC-2 type transport system permease protein
MTGFLTLELRRCLRDVRYLVIAVAMPIGLYLLFTGLFGSHGQRAQGLPQPKELMIAMVAYGAMWAAFSATGPRIAHERAIGWTRQLRVTPLTPASALSGKLVTALAAALPAMVLVALTAVISHNVRLSAAQWPALLAAMWAGVLPLALLGLAIGYLAGDDIAFPITMALYFALGALGGLWIPPSAMPHAMQDIAQFLPSNAVAELGRRIGGGQSSALRAVLVLTAWTLGSGLVALLAYRRQTRPLRSPGTSHDRSHVPVAHQA